MESLTGCPLEVLKSGQLVHTRGSDVHVFIVQGNRQVAEPDQQVLLTLA
ncbi:hypothetical protein AB0A81_32290 [Streptomyces flaveolus]|uniref:Uncharacterized protein n=1 Tax=Streptomyces flaveolus TaxID=67297 RepID=A0ABV1VJ44_9ACTN